MIKEVWKTVIVETESKKNAVVIICHNGEMFTLAPIPEAQKEELKKYYQENYRKDEIVPQIDISKLKTSQK